MKFLNFFLTGIPYKTRFPMPNNEKYWYSISLPLIHIIVMSSEHNFTKDSEQYNWLINDLSNVNHNEKWTIFFGHRYVSGMRFFGGD